MDTILAHLCTIISNQYSLVVVATRQNSSNGKPKSPRVQVVLPEGLCDRLSALAERELRTVSNMAKVLIQEGVNQYEKQQPLPSNKTPLINSTEGFRSALEAQELRRLKGAPKRIRLQKPLVK